MTASRQRFFKIVTSAATAPALALAGCTTAKPNSAAVARRTPPATAVAFRETDALQTANADASVDPPASFSVTPDKKAGLNVYDLIGRERHSIDAGHIDNADLIETSVVCRPAMLVAPSDCKNPPAVKIALFRLYTADARFVPAKLSQPARGKRMGSAWRRAAAASTPF